ncbi:MAG: EAL domain-containing protein, partial [Pseudomonadota bacterium]
DFGTGYSSLAYFRDIPADEVKLDKMFVQRMVSNEADRKIARLVIELAHAFDMSITAEGVEDADTFRLLASMGCDYAQGFFIAKPMPHEDYLVWLRQYDGLSQSGAKFCKAS